MLETLKDFMKKFVNNTSSLLQQSDTRNKESETKINYIDIRSKLKKLARNESYSDLLTYSLLLEDGIILHKDGSLSVSFNYLGPDIDSETDGSVDSLSAQITHSLSQLDDGWMVEENLISSQSPHYTKSDNFHDPVSEIIDIERENLFKSEGVIYKTSTVLTFTFTQTKQQIERLKNFSIDRSETSTQEVGFLEIVTKFKQSVAGIINLMQAYNIKCEQLKDNETLTYLFNCVNLKDVKICGSQSNMFLDSFLVEQDMRPGIDIMVGNKHVAVLALDDMPAEYYPTILDDLSQLRAEFRWSTRFVPLPDELAQKIFKKKITEWKSKVGGFSGMMLQLMGKQDHRRDRNAENMQEMTEEALAQHSAGKLFGYMNSTVIVYHEDKSRLEDTVALITKTIQSKGFSKVRRETINATEAFLGALPSHGGYNPRKIPVSIEFIADLFPTTGIYQGKPHATNPSIGKDRPALLETMTRGSRKFSLNLHHMDAGHTAIYGPTGTGKSVLLSMIIASWFKKYPNVRVIGSDYNYGLLGTTISMNGSYIDILSENIKLSPMVGVDDENYRKGFLNSWLNNIFSLHNNQKTNSKQKTAILESLDRVALMNKEDHTLVRFIAQLDDEDLQMTFKNFANSVPNDVLSGSGDDDIFVGDFNLFEKKNILELDDEIKVPILEYIYFKQRKMVQDNPAPTLMIMDEASFEMNDPILRVYFMDTIKTGRHNDIALIFATQSIKDVSVLGEPSRVQDNIKTQIYLPNYKAFADKSVREVYEWIGLNEQEIKLISESEPKAEYYIKQELGNKLMRLKVGYLALAFIGMTIKDKSKLEALKKTYLPHDRKWALKWLEHCGYVDEVKVLENMKCFRG